MQTSVEILAECGYSFVERASTRPSSDTELPVSVIQGSKRGGARNDGTSLEIVTGISFSGDTHIMGPWLDAPLFGWDGSADHPEFVKKSNPVMNTSECDPAAMMNLALGIIEGDTPCATEVKQPMIDRIGAVLFAGATPQMLAEDLKDDVGLIFKDPEHASTHAVSARLFYSMLAENRLFVFDIHDLAHHALQLQLWPEFFSQLGAISFEAFRSSDPPTRETTLARHLSGLVVDAVFEESIIAAGDELNSFGCLNWLSPRDTPVAKPEFVESASLEDQRLVRRWHSLYAIKDLYRTQRLASDFADEGLDW